EDIRIVGQPQSAEQLLNTLEKLRARVLILSSGFLSLLTEIQEIAASRGVSLLMLVENTETASDFMRMGVPGVIYRCASGNVVVEAVRRLSRGEPFLQSPNRTDGEVSEDLVGARVRDRLSDKELRIIASVVQGFKNRDIALQLYTSEQMVKNSLRNIFDKIGVSDRLELALFTIHHRILAQATASVPGAPKQRRNGRSVDTRARAATPPPTAIN
ncbi:MAG TPA: response regulator transcription factor, partial [Terriglobales bacterium]|nr:response regulator transcription factor [Terriglobales bacterium]